MRDPGALPGLRELYGGMHFQHLNFRRFIQSSGIRYLTCSGTCYTQINNRPTDRMMTLKDQIIEHAVLDLDHQLERGNQWKNNKH